MNPKKKPQQQKKVPNIANQITIAIFIFIIITLIYSWISGSPSNIKNLTISDVAKNVAEGTIEKIDVVSQDITVKFKDKSEGVAKKETESSLSETLFNY